MDRNISEQLNKAFEAYRNVSIEKELVRKELLLKSEQYQRHTQMLERKIEEQAKTILHLKAELSSVRKHASEEVCEPAYRKKEVETLSPSDHRSDNPSSPHRTNHFMIKEPTEYSGMLPHTISAPGEMKSENFLDTWQEIQGTFQRIQTLTRRQKDHLKRIHKGNETSNVQFSMPIQCTDDTAEQAEVPFSSPLRSEVDESSNSASLASRGAVPDKTSFDHLSLSGLSVKFPPNTDDEYDFLNSTPDKRVDLPLHRLDLGDQLHTMREESCSSYPAPSSSAHTSASASSASHENVRGPQQLFWTPDLPDVSAQASGTDAQQMNSREKCAFCKDDVPPNHMYSHLNSHFKNKADD
ncbi:TRAF family member-associated NF-kappa-B activator [Pimephales promelas]|uniref:TRAF family member-associated NF-kappa-B activator n=1 Tax=Pimephales promelas TaxID=90988 RepID=UPI001955BE89|nr:TRAF family member-associated NF-kappa-B activator [Pimephales promelas]KAG1945017.1 TRAF family member-associated NF-kappa-B activator [Pimephales promelas]KAG1945018.1 TRAF family member-associated NF-kappa-B activator [Pimephales promelas]